MANVWRPVLTNGSFFVQWANNSNTDVSWVNNTVVAVEWITPGAAPQTWQQVNNTQ